MYKVTLYNRRSYPNNGQVLLDTSSGTNPGIASAMVDSKLNEAGSFTFTIVSSHPLYEDASLVPMKGYVSVEDDGDEIFWGRIITIQKNPLSGSKQITCEGALAFMLDAELPIDTEAVSMSAADYFEYCVNKYNTQIGTDAARNILVGKIDIDEADEVHEYKNTEYTQIQSVMKSKLIDCVNGFIHIWRDPDTKKHYIDWTAESGVENPQAVKIKENVVNQTSKESGDDIYTKIRAVGSKSGDTRPELQPVALDSGMVNDYGTIIRTVTFGEATTAEALQSELNTYISQIRERLSLSGEINFVDLHFLDEEETKVMCGDIFTNIVGYPNKRLIAGSLSRDLLNPANDKISLNSEKDVQGKLNAIGANSGISSGASSSSGKGRSLSSGGSNWYKHIHETDETLSLTAKQLEVTASKVTAIIGDADITVTTLSSLSGRVTTQEGKWTSFEGTRLYQDQDHVTTIAGNFSVDSQTGYMRLNEGTQFDISPTGVNSNVGKLVYSHDGRQKEIGELLMAYEGSYVYQHNDDISGIVGRYQVRTSLNPEQPYVAVSAPATEAEKALLNDSGGPAGRNYYEYNSKKDEYFKSTDTTYNDKKTYYKLNYIVDGVTFDAGGGFKVKTDGVEYGVYDEGNLTGGIIVNKVNGNETETKILGSHVKVGTEGTKDVSLADVITITTRENSTSVKSEKTFWVDGGNIVATTKNKKGGKVTGNLGVFGLLTLDGVNGRLDISPSMSSGSSTHSYIGYGDLPNLVKKIALVNNSNGSYDLLYVPASTATYAQTPTYASHDGWISAGTFSKATSLTGAWSGIDAATGDIYTITGTPDQNPKLEKSIGFSGVSSTKHELLMLTFTAQPSAVTNDYTSSNRKKVNVPVAVQRLGSSENPINVYTKTLTNLDASGVYDNGWKAAHYAASVPTEANTQTGEFVVHLPVLAPDNGYDEHTYTINNNNNNITLVQNESGVIVAKDAHNHYNEGWGAAQLAFRTKPNRTTPAPGEETAVDNELWVQYPNSTVGGDPVLRRFYVTSTNTSNYAYIRVGSTSGTVVARSAIGRRLSIEDWKNGKITFSANGTGSTTSASVNLDAADPVWNENENTATVAIYDGDPGNGGSPTGFSVEVDATGRYNAGFNTVSSPSFSSWSTAGVAQAPTSNITSNTITFATDNKIDTGSTPRTGTRTIHLTQSASWSGHKKSVYMRDGSASGLFVGRIEVDASSEFTDGQNDIINSGKPLTQNGPCSGLDVNRYVTTLTVTNASSGGQVAYDSSYVPSEGAIPIQAVKPVSSGGYPFLRIWARDNGLTGDDGDGGNRSRTIEVFAGSSPVETLSITDYKSGWNAGGENAKIRWVKTGEYTGSTPGRLDPDNTYAVSFTNASGTMQTNQYWYVPAMSISCNSMGYSDASAQELSANTRYRIYVTYKNGSGQTVTTKTKDIITPADSEESHDRFGKLTCYNIVSLGTAGTRYYFYGDSGNMSKKPSKDSEYTLYV